MSHQGAPIPECVTTPGDNCQPVQLVILCDQHPPPDAGDGALVPFLRRYIFNCDTGAVLGFTDTDFDGNPYIIQGTVESCSGGTTAAGNTIVRRELCDLGALPQVQFLRTEVLDAFGVPFITSNTEADGTTPYVVIGPVDFECDCTTCTPDAPRQHRIELSGISAWARPAGTIAVTVKCRAVGNVLTPPTITDADLVVSPLYVGDEESWQTDEPFADPFTVTLADVADVVTIIWIEVT